MEHITADPMPTLYTKADDPSSIRFACRFATKILTHVCAKSENAALLHQQHVILAVCAGSTLSSTSSVPCFATTALANFSLHMQRLASEVGMITCAMQSSAKLLSKTRFQKLKPFCCIFFMRARGDFVNLSIQHPDWHFTPEEELMLGYIATGKCRLSDDLLRHIADCGDVIEVTFDVPLVAVQYYGLRGIYIPNTPRIHLWRDSNGHRPRFTLDQLKHAGHSWYGMCKTKAGVKGWASLPPCIRVPQVMLGTSILDLIPQSLLWLLFPLDIIDLYSIALVCKAFYLATKSPYLWNAYCKKRGIDPGENAYNAAKKRYRNTARYKSCTINVWPWHVHVQKRSKKRA